LSPECGALQGGDEFRIVGQPAHIHAPGLHICRRIGEQLIDAVGRFRRGRVPEDDETIVVLQRLPDQIGSRLKTRAAAI
jgi:hypothetical protein